MILKINPNNSENKGGNFKTNEAHGESFETAGSRNKPEDWEEATEEDLESGNFEKLYSLNSFKKYYVTPSLIELL